MSYQIKLKETDKCNRGRKGYELSPDRYNKDLPYLSCNHPFKHLKLLSYYHVGAFAFTGSGKSNLTSLIVRKAMNSVPNVKFVVFDISSEYGVNILDLLRSYPSRIVLTEPLPGYGNDGAKDNTTVEKMAEDYLVRHVVPEALVEVKKEILESVKEIIVQDKIRMLTIPSESEQIMRQFSTYGGLLRSLAELTNEKFGAAAQKVLIPAVVDMIKKFMKEKKLNEDSLMNVETIPLIKSIMGRLSQAVNARNGNKKAGIVWHTQGSRKSLTMIFYAGKLVTELDNPTIVVLTDRNDLDDQLFGTFGRCQNILRQEPVLTMEHCKQCAQTCRKCASECRKMAR